MGVTERARPVLGAQPAPPGTTPLHLVGTESNHSEGEYPPSIIRYEDELASLQLAVNQPLNMDSPDSLIQVPDRNPGKLIFSVLQLRSK